MRTKLKVDLSWQQWDKKAQYRCLHYKFKEQLEWLKDFYPEKIARLQGRLDDILVGHVPALKEDVIFLQERIARLTDKFQTTLKEIEGRKLGYFKNRPEHGTIYYIDLDGGNDASDGLGTGTAWLTILKYTSTTVRTAGDIAKVRANTTEVTAANVVFDEAGTQDDYIEIRGCSSADDPWTDSSDVKPSLSFGDNNVRLSASEGNDFWKINRLVVKESDSAIGNISLSVCKHWYFLDCESTDCNNAAGSGLYTANSSEILIEGCSFKDNLYANLNSASSSIRVLSSILDGGAATTDYGLRNVYGITECIDTSFGQTNEHDLADIYMQRGGMVKLRNCPMATVGYIISDANGIILEEDADGTYGAGLITGYQGTITKDTGIKTGAANFSLKIEPNTNCGVDAFLTPNHNSIIEYPFVIQCTTGVSKTVTVQIRSLGTWGTYPVAAELFLEFWYLDHATNATRTKVVSTDVLSHASNWVNFTCTFTPLQTGLAYGTVKMGIYEDAGDGAYVNGEAT